MTRARPSPRIDIVVDARAPADRLCRCVEAVLANTDGDFRLLLVDAAPEDQSPGALVEGLAQRGLRGISVLPGSLEPSFAVAANRAVAASHADVVLVDPGMIATPGWFEALQRCAASDPRIATATSFSNAGGICSFPRLCRDEPWPVGADTRPTLAAIAEAAAPTYPDPPVGTGPCLYVRRQALRTLGGFDPGFATLRATQADFCMRALRAHWRNALADDAFVIGGVAEGAQRDCGAARHQDDARDKPGALAEDTARERDDARLALRHPYLADVVGAFVTIDPLRPLREAALSRMLVAGPAPGVLHVIHDHGGGVETHVRALTEALSDGWRHCVATAAGDLWQVDEYPGDGARRRFEFVRRDGESWHDFIGAIAASFRISLIHIHHLLHARKGVVAALQSLGLPWGITIHDLWLACPTVTLSRADGRHCGGETDAALCTRCLDAQPAFAGTDIVQWRREHAALAAGAAFLIAPSQWAAAMFVRYFPDAAPRVHVIAHATPDAWAQQSETDMAGEPLRAVLLPDDDLPTVAIVGAIGQDKGARRVERLAQRARERGARLRLVVIGYLDVQNDPWQSPDAVLTVHGRYTAQDLPKLFAHYRVALVAYPSEGPESFSYTLSETWAAGLPALVPPIGALAERIAQSGAGWVMTEDEWHDDDRMLDRIVALIGADQADERARAAANARTAARSLVAVNVEVTTRLYARALADAGAQPGEGTKAFPPARMRDALGYRKWEPPLIHHPIDHPLQAALGSTRATVGGGRWRRMLGRCLDRIGPAQLIDVLKARRRSRR